MFKELLADAWPIVQKIAPAIAAALGGPSAGLALTALLAIGKKFDVQDITQLAQHILSDTNAESKLQEADLDFSDEITKAAVKSISKLQSLKANIELTWQS